MFVWQNVSKCLAERLKWKTKVVTNWICIFRINLHQQKIDVNNGERIVSAATAAKMLKCKHMLYSIHSKENIVLASFATCIYAFVGKNGRQNVTLQRFASKSLEENLFRILCRWRCQTINTDWYLHFAMHNKCFGIISYLLKISLIWQYCMFPCTRF